MRATPWIRPELLLLPALLLGAALVAGGAVPAAQEVELPGQEHVGRQPVNAVLLEDADLYATPSSDGEVVAHLPAGSVLVYGGETRDVYTRAWFMLHDPDRLRPRRQSWLAPFGFRELVGLGGSAAVLADRVPAGLARGGRNAGIAAIAAAGRGAARGAAVTSGAAGAQGAAAQTTAAGAISGLGTLPQAPWWSAAGELDIGDAPAFGEVVAVSARAVDEGDVREAIELLGGREGLADWPARPSPGELFVPELLPVLFAFDGADWRIARPTRLLGPGLNLLGNPLLAVDPTAPPMAGGPALSCWDLVGALTPRGDAAGSIQAAPVATPPRGRRLPLPAAGEQDPALAQPRIQQMIPPASDASRVPPRVDPPDVPTGVELRDGDGRQAVYLEQELDAALVRRLRGRDLTLDIVARTPANAAAAATFGIDIQTAAGDAAPGHTTADFTVDANPLIFHTRFTVPDGAERVVVRLLPLDRSLAVEQQGAVIFERVALRLSSWPARLPAATVLLNRVTATSWEGAPLHTRSPIALTLRPPGGVLAIWPRIAASAWSIADKQLILAGELRHGMDPDQVRTSWGRALEEVPGGPGVDRRWVYGDRTVTFADGKVIAFTIDEEQGAAPASLRCSGGSEPPPGAVATIDR